MPYSFSDVIFLFVIYSFVGWLWETVYCSILDKRFAYRGFLFGPYCPVYGFAVTTVLICTEPFQTSPLILFLVGMVIATLFEYLAGWFLETFFHLKLWDYSKEKGNIKGRIAPRISLFWGVGVLVLVRFIQPPVMALIDSWQDWWALVVVVLMLSDLVWTMAGTLGFHKSALALEGYLRVERERMQNSVRQEVDDLTQQAELFSHRLQYFRSHIEDFLQTKDFKPLSFHQRRLLKNYSKFKAIDAPLLTEIHKQIASFKNNSAKKK